MNRREMLKTAAAAALTSGLPAIHEPIWIDEDLPADITDFWAAVDAVIQRERGRIGLTDLMLADWPIEIVPAADPRPREKPRLFVKGRFE